MLTLALANQTRSLLAELDTRLHSIDAKRETRESALESRSAEAANPWRISPPTFAQTLQHT